METSLDSLSARDIIDAPVYCDEKGDWNIFRSDGERIGWSRLEESGDVSPIARIDPSEVRLLEPSGGGLALLKDYVRTLNGRDSVLGYAYYLVDNFGYEDFVSNVYFGVIATAVLDLLWRASLLGRLKGPMSGKEGVREGIIFYDMDRLDAPTIGAFV